METAGRPRLEVHGVSKYFGSVNALQDVSLQVFPGQVTCVLGDNGARKSTLLRRGRLLGSYAKSETSVDELAAMMAGGAELQQLSEELAAMASDKEIAEAARELAVEAAEIPGGTDGSEAS